MIYERVAMKQVKVDTILVESDAVGKAMMDLIAVLNMRKLILGTSKSNLRYITACNL